MVKLSTLNGFLNDYLESDRIRDYSPNGIQVESCDSVSRVVTGVTACQALIEAAIERQADLLLVHHGYFWKGENPCITGIKSQRIGALMRNGISLIAYHLPLDLHPQIGNNMMIAKHLALEVDGSFYPYNGTDLALTATLKSPMSIEELTEWLAQSFGRPPQVVGNGKAVVERIGWSSGASQDAIEAAAAEGLDLFISGEISERTVHLAREMGIYYVAAGHHATEKWGIEALGRIVEKEFSIPCEFVDIDNPV